MHGSMLCLAVFSSYLRHKRTEIDKPRIDSLRSQTIAQGETPFPTNDDNM